MTSEWLGEMFEGYSADTCTGKFPLLSMGGRAEGLAFTDPGARTPIGASGNFHYYYIKLLKTFRINVILSGIHLSKFLTFLIEYLKYSTTAIFCQISISLLN